jgi:hypothetical protein
MLPRDGSLVRPQQPTLEQRHHAVHPRQKMLALALVVLDLAVVNVAYQAQVRSQAVGSDGAAGLIA